MAHSLRKHYGGVPEAYLTHWDEAIKQRNRLMHRYFVDLVATLDLADAEAVEQTVQITDLACDIFQAARQACQDVQSGTLANLDRLVAERSNDEAPPPP